MLARAREQGKAPAILIHLGPGPAALAGARLADDGRAGPVFLLQLTPAGAVQPEPERGDAALVERLIERVPDGFVVLDAEGVILRANQAFLDLVQAASEEQVLGERLGAGSAGRAPNLPVLLANLQRHGSVQRFVDHAHGRARHRDRGRDLGRRRRRQPAAASWPCCCATSAARAAARQRAVWRHARPAGPAQVGRQPLRDLVRDTVGHRRAGTISRPRSTSPTATAPRRPSFWA